MPEVAAIPVHQAALFLDVDNTIVPVGEAPAAVKAGPACRIVLRRALDELHGRLAILSGRTIGGVDEALGGVVSCVAGVHGLQRRTALRKVHTESTHKRLGDAVSVLAPLVHARPGLRLETTGASVAIHYRQALGAEAAVIETVERLAAAFGLQAQFGRATAELRPSGPDKGTALRRFMLETPFAGARPIMLGGDLTDEAAFGAVRTFGGIGLRVGAAARSLAHAQVSAPSAALSWIMRCLDRGRFELPAGGRGGAMPAPA
jgi:trehalose 6-phosphate phosphatase